MNPIEEATDKKSILVSVKPPPSHGNSSSRDGSTTPDTMSSNEKEAWRRPYKDPRRELHPSTAVIMAGYRSDLSESAIKPPVFRSSTFEFTSAAAGELFFQRAYNLPGDDGEKPGLIYSRLNNPNTEILEDKMVALEKGSNFASAFPSGMSAISTTLMVLVEMGGHVIYVSHNFTRTQVSFYAMYSHKIPWSI